VRVSVRVRLGLLTCFSKSGGGGGGAGRSASREMGARRDGAPSPSAKRTSATEDVLSAPAGLGVRGKGRGRSRGIKGEGAED